MSDAGFPSGNQIDKAGKYLRECIAGRIVDPDPERYERSIDVVTTFREAHGYPMGKIRMGLTSMVNTLALDAAVSQRHKRVPRIVRKLVRHHGTACSRLEDIGGCRVVVQNAADMEALCRRIKRNWSSAFARDPRDYITTPKEMGYRARHFVVVRDGRAIEVQVRTVGQQRWADAVEAIDGRLQGINLKDENGPAGLKEYFELAGEIIYRQEWKVPIDRPLFKRFTEARETVVREGYYRR